MMIKVSLSRRYKNYEHMGMSHQSPTYMKQKLTEFRGRNLYLNKIFGDVNIPPKLITINIYIKK